MSNDTSTVTARPAETDEHTRPDNSSSPSSSASSSSDHNPDADLLQAWITDKEALRSSVQKVIDGRWADFRQYSREQVNHPKFVADGSRSSEDAREHALKILAEDLVSSGMTSMSLPEEYGGQGDVGASVIGMESLAHMDLSLMVKAGVQFGLFGGAIENLGTKRHHEKYLAPMSKLELPGCFAMTESGHGSNVQALEVTATYDPATQEFAINSPTPSSRKDYIGNAAAHGKSAAVFAQLITGKAGEEPQEYGVHCFIVPIRDEDGNDLPGVTLSDCGHKEGLLGVDNGRIMFDNVRIPRENLLNRYGDVAADGTYSSPIDSTGKRFFTMLGTLIRGRVGVGGAAGAAARTCLTIAVKYALARRQFEAPGDEDGSAHEITIMDYRVHQRRLLPLIAKSYALLAAQNELVEDLHETQSPHGTKRDDAAFKRELESRAAGMKAVTSWHAQKAITEAREACGGAGYLTNNLIATFRRDVDVFTTFEGDNHIMVQQVAKELLTAYSGDMRAMDTVGWMKFFAGTAREVFFERSAARQVVQSILDKSDEDPHESDLTNRATQIRLFEAREKHLLRTLAMRLRGGSDDDDPFETFNNAQDHLISLGVAHMDRVILESFITEIVSVEDGPTKDLLWLICDLYVYSTLEENIGWYLMHRHVSVERAKAIRRGVGDLCKRLRPFAETIVDAFSIPSAVLDVEMIRDNS